MPDALITLQKLPPVAYIDNSHDESPGAPPVIAVKRGVMGYFPVHTRLTAAVLNKNAGVTPMQAEAMHIGSSFGWDASGADPDNLVDRP